MFFLNFYKKHKTCFFIYGALVRNADLQHLLRSTYPTQARTPRARSVSMELNVTVFNTAASV